MVELVPAAERGDLATVEAYIAKGVNLNLRGEVWFSKDQPWSIFFQPSQFLALIIILFIITIKLYFKYRSVILCCSAFCFCLPFYR